MKLEIDYKTLSEELLEELRRADMDYKSAIENDVLYKAGKVDGIREALHIVSKLMYVVREG